MAENSTAEYRIAVNNAAIVINNANNAAGLIRKRETSGI